MFKMLIFGLGIFELKLATLELELAILLGIFESELGIFGLKLATLEPELAILLSIFESELGIFELKLATLGTRTCNLTKRKFTISFCIFRQWHSFSVMVFDKSVRVGI